jgi:chaperonin GroES
MKKNSKLIEKLKPLADRVLVRPAPQEDEIEGIMLSEDAKERPQRGEIVAAGPGIREDGKLVRLDVKKGDRIIFGKNLGSEIEVGGEKLLIMRQDDILGII